MNTTRPGDHVIQACGILQQLAPGTGLRQDSAASLYLAIAVPGGGTVTVPQRAAGRS
jgi:hypothetical protein